MDLLDAEVKIENPDEPEDGESSLAAGKKPRFTLDEDAAMWKFVGENLHLGPMKMWEEFKKHEGSDRASHGLYRRFKRSLAPNLHLTNLDIPTKLEIYKKYQIPVDLTYIETLKMHANLEIDYSGCIRNYNFTESSRSRKPKRPEKQAVFVFPNSDDEDVEDVEAASGENGAENVNPELAKLVLETYQQQQMHQNPTNPEEIPDQNPESESSHQSNSNYQRFTPEEDASLWKFVIENPECRGSLKMWEGYRKMYQTKRSLSSLYFRFKKVLSPNLHRCDFDVETKLKLYKNYQIPVDQEYLTVLRNQAKLEIDESWCIVSYHLGDEQKVPEKRRTSSERLPEENLKSKRQKTVRKDSEIQKDQKEGSVGAENTSTSSSNISEFIEGVLEQFQQEFDETMAQETREPQEPQQKEDPKDPKDPKDREEQKEQKDREDQKDEPKIPIPDLQNSEFEARIIAEVTRNVGTMISEMTRNMEGKMAKIAETVGELKDTVQVMRESQIDKDSVVIKKSDLEKLQNMLQTMKSAEMDEIQKRISTAMEK